MTASGRKSLSVCPRGHDLELVGRALNGRCRECKREYDRSRAYEKYRNDFAYWVKKQIRNRRRDRSGGR